jgi:hypothetical protein
MFAIRLLLLLGILAAAVDEGVGLDPFGRFGSQSDAGAGIDPEGRPTSTDSDEGSGLDPHG